MIKLPIPKPQDDPEQAKRFIDMAKELGAEETEETEEAEEAFEKTLEKITKPRSIKQPPPEKS